MGKGSVQTEQYLQGDEVMSPENETIVLRLANLEKSTADMAVAVKSIAESLTTLARLEVRHEETRDRIGRAFAEIERSRSAQDIINKDIETRARAIEAEMPTMKMTRGWAITGATSAVGILCIAIIALVMK